MGHHSFRSVLTALVAVALLSGFAPATNLPALPPEEASSSIRAVDLKRHLSFLASDELGGRYTLSPSNRIAARYLASQLESYGYRGAAGGSFFQKVPLVYTSIDAAKSRVTIAGATAKQEFKYADDFNSTPAVSADCSGDLVFVGYGISSPNHKYDDYATLDVKGKVVVAVSGHPAALKGVALSEAEQGEDAAVAHGAVGTIVISQQYLLVWDQLRTQLLAEQQQFGLHPRKRPTQNAFSLINAGPRLIKALANLMGKEESYLTSANGKPLQPGPIKASADIRVNVTVKDAPPAQNVAGILDGSDPKFKDEYVVFSAHYDHLQTESNGEVYNGADDDGSGTVSVLEIAEALAIGTRPKRSVLIIFHTGEELGLFGSEFNADYSPVVPLKKLVVDLNIDMVGRSRPEGDTDPRDRMLTDKDSIYIIGSDKLSSELHEVNEKTNAETARLRLDYTYNPESHPERFYYRSDHYNYAKHGIPVIFYFTGVHRDYHRTTDDVDKIDFVKMERIDRMIFAVGWRIANLDHRLIVDKKPIP